MSGRRGSLTAVISKGFVLELLLIKNTQSSTVSIYEFLSEPTVLSLLTVNNKQTKKINKHPKNSPSHLFHISPEN